MTSLRAVPAALAVVVVAVACGSKPPAKIANVGRLVLDDAGTEVEVPVERLDLFLASEGSGHSDGFVLLGEGLVLPGALAPDLRIGSSGDWEVALHRSLSIRREHRPGGEEPFQAYVILPGRGRMTVLGGDLKMVEILGPNPEGPGAVVRLEVHLLLESGRSLDGAGQVVAVTSG